MYYIVKFVDSNSIGIIKRSWMINKNRCKYPKGKEVSKLLINSSEFDDMIGWKEFNCILKHPLIFGDEGIKTLKKAQKKEAFYVNYSDTDEFERKKTFKKIKKEHPVSKLAQQTDLNHLLASTSTGLRHSEHPKKFEIVETTSMNEERVQEENIQISQSEVMAACASIESGIASHETNITSFQEVIQEDIGIYDTDSIPQVIAELIPSGSSSQDFLSAIMPHLKHIISQNNEMLNEQIKINTQLEKIDARLKILEDKYDCDGDHLDNFTISKIDSPLDFHNFLKRIQNDKAFKANLVLYLIKSCVQGSSKYYHYGILKCAIQLIMTENFQKLCWWGAPKSKKNECLKELNSGKNECVILSEFTLFKNLMLEVINGGNKKDYSQKDVAAGLREYFKRFERTVDSSDDED